MCRLLSTYGNPENWKQILYEFQKQANTGNIPPVEGLEPGHKDGWGMAKSNIGKSSMEVIGKFLGSAIDAEEYGNIIKSIDTPPSIFMFHLRKASPGIQISLSNAHPFQQKKWIFSHNGTIYNANELLDTQKYKMTSDESDSEYYFHYLLNEIEKEGSESSLADKLVKALKKITVQFTSLNCMLTNGSELYAVRYCSKHEEYYSLVYYETPEGIVISSEPIRVQGYDYESWKELPNRSIIRISGNPYEKKVYRF